MAIRALDDWIEVYTSSVTNAYGQPDIDVSIGAGSEMTRLLERVQDLESAVDNYSRVLLEEAQLRASNPSVNDAYEAYQTIANLAKSHSSVGDNGGN